MAEVTPAEKVTSKRQNLEYPLNNPDEFLGRLKFSLLEEPQNLVNLVADTTASVTRAGISTAEGSTTGEDAVEETRAETMAKIDAFAGVGNQTKKGKPQMNRTGQSVKLYLPTGLAYRDTVNYDNMDIGGMGAAAEGAAIFVSSHLHLDSLQHLRRNQRS